MKRSLTTIIADKILDNLEAMPLSHFVFRTFLFLMACMVTFAALYPQNAHDFIRAVWMWQNGAIIKTTFIFFLVFNIQKIGTLGVKVWKNAQTTQKIETGNTIEGIPTVELLDHLFNHQSFKREEIEKKFWIPRNRYTTLAMKLENIGVLIRGENNARVLNTEYARADIAAILENVDNARALKAVFREVAPGSFTREPTGKTILEKVQSALSPLPSPRRFELHKLENTENA